MTNCVSCPKACKNPFCNLSEATRSFLDANSIPMEYRRGNILFREGDESSAVFLICSGRVKVSATSSEGRTLILRIASDGDVLGIGAAMRSGDSGYEVTAEAVEPCQVRVLRMKFFKQMLANYPDAGLGVARALTVDYRAAFDEACLIGLPGSPAARLARLILDWTAEAQSKAPHCAVTMPLTHDEIASMTATTRETVTRTLGRFRKDRLIATRGVVLNVLQPAELERLSAC